MTLMNSYGLEYGADADFNYTSRSMPEELLSQLAKEKIIGCSFDDTADLLCYRQLHNLLLVNSPLTRRVLEVENLADLHIASCLAPCASNNNNSSMFQHPSGYQVEAKEEIMWIAFGIGLGIPFNLTERAALLHLVRRLTGYTPRWFNYFIGDAHIYESHLNILQE